MIDFWDKVNKLPGEGCWLWTGARTDRGYGSLSRAFYPRLAHQYSFKLAYGYVPRTIHHKCEVKHCVRPEHLVDASQSQNVLASLKGRCRKGHLLEGANVERNAHGRQCKKCHDEAKHRQSA